MSDTYLYVVFVPDAAGDKETRLHAFLVDQHVGVSRAQPMSVYPANFQSRGACFIFCRDADPPADLGERVSRCAAALGSPHRAVFFHANTHSAGPLRKQFADRQMDLLSSGGPLHGFEQFAYTRSPHTPVYEAMLRALDRLRDGDRFEPVQRIMMAPTLLSHVGTIKHRMSHVFLHVSVDVQTLLGEDSGPAHWPEIVEAYRTSTVQDRLTLAGTLIAELLALGKKSASSKVVRSAERLLEMLSPNDPQYEATAAVLAALGRDDGAAEAQEHGPAFLEWHRRFERIWDELIESLEADTRALAKEPAGTT
jgi:hypothetical protein